MSLSIAVRPSRASEASADVLVVALWAFDTKTLPEELALFDRALGGGLLALMKREEFSGKKEQQLSFATLGKLPSARVILVGLGERAKITAAEVRTFGSKAGRAANADRAKTLALGLPAGLEAFARELVEGIELGAYRFTRYLTGDRAPKASLANVTIHGVALDKKAVAVGQSVADGVNLARDLSNEPPNTLTPAALATEATKIGKKFGLKTTVIGYKELVRRGMSLIDAVGRGSVNEPCLVHVAYAPKKAGSKKKLVFVGKGITFDTGGISIKPAAGMGEMKHDMSGAANVVGLMAIVGALKPDCEVHGIFAAAENMPDGNAYRPGDVWGSLDGRTVEIVNTDAEGRLILADALAYARELNPDILVDNATLTGAMVVSLGSTCSGYFAASDESARDFADAIKDSGEQMWRLPLLEELRDQLKSEVADIKHTGDRYGGSISAALFLREFAGNIKHWIHADIAGPAMSDRQFAWNPKGATGHGVLTFYSLIERAASGKLTSTFAATPPKASKPKKATSRKKR